MSVLSSLSFIWVGLSPKCALTLGMTTCSTSCHFHWKAVFSFCSSRLIERFLDKLWTSFIPERSFVWEWYWGKKTLRLGYHDCKGKDSLQVLWRKHCEQRIDRSFAKKQRNVIFMTSDKQKSFKIHFYDQFLTDPQDVLYRENTFSSVVQRPVLGDSIRPRSHFSCSCQCAAMLNNENHNSLWCPFTSLQHGAVRYLKRCRCFFWSVVWGHVAFRPRRL